MGTFEHGNGTLEIPLLEGETAKSVLRVDRTMEVSTGVGYPGCFFAAGAPLGELPQLSQAINHPVTGSHGGNYRAEALVEQLAFEGRDGLSEHVHGVTVIPQRGVDGTQEAVH